MKNNKGQALVEFVIIIPIFILLIISVIDLFNILLKKYSLENDLDTIVDMYKMEDYNNISDYANNKDIKVNYSNNNDMLVISINKDIKIISPILTTIFGDTYEVNIDRSIYRNE